MRYALEISFDGTAYCGWQRQKNALSVQAVLEENLAVLTGMDCRVHGCGRTDTGVHAKNFVLHFDCASNLPKNFIHRINRILPEDIAVHQLYIVPEDFNARFDAQYRTYHYRINRFKDPFIRPYSYLYSREMDVKILNKGAQVIKQYNDFGSFCKSKSQNKTNLCRIMECKWESQGNEYLFIIGADRFLRNMVRAITGTLLELNEGKIDLDGLHGIIQSGDRKKAGRSAPGHGLTLVEVKYDRTNWQQVNDG